MHVKTFSVCVSTDELPYLKCPLHTVLKLTPIAYGKLFSSLKAIEVYLLCIDCH